jgi:hypothetical protein
MQITKSTCYLKQRKKNKGVRSKIKPWMIISKSGSTNVAGEFSILLLLPEFRLRVDQIFHVLRKSTLIIS